MNNYKRMSRILALSALLVMSLMATRARAAAGGLAIRVPEQVEMRTASVDIRASLVAKDSINTSTISAAILIMDSRVGLVISAIRSKSSANRSNPVRVLLEVISVNQSRKGCANPASS